MKRLLIGFALLLPITLCAEGTKELAPTSADPSTLTPSGSSTQFAEYNVGDSLRLYIDIKDFTNETIYLGFQENQSNSIYYRVKDPTGAIVHGPTAMPGSGAGYIANHAQAVVGPIPLGGAGGYTPDTYTPTMNGSHYIEFNYNHATVKDVSTCYIDLWDITVGDNTTSNPILGRIHSQSWSMSSGSFTTNFWGKFYIYTTDSVVTRLDVNGFQPFEFFINCNSFGVQNTGDFIVDRMSIASFAHVPEYKIFLNDPDSTCYPTGQFSQILNSTPTIIGCDTSYCIQVDYSKAATAQLVLDLDGTIGYQTGTEDVLFIQKVDAGPNCFYWDGKDNFGATVTPNQNIKLISAVVSGLTNFPIWDAECNPNGFIVDVIRPTAPRPNLFYDDTNLGGGSNTIIGCIAPCHSWATTGTCSSTSIGNAKLINTYWFSSTDLVSYLAFLPYCPPYTVNDTSITDQGASVSVDVLNNDIDPNDDIVNSSVGVVGGGPPNGSITNINTTTGAITYLPIISFIGTDSFDYVVCDGQSLCDTARVYIIVVCPLGGNSNVMSGFVFYDYPPSDGIMGSGDIGISSVDVDIYRDVNMNGLLDGPDNFITTVTSNGTGAYTFSPTDNFGTITRALQIGTDDAEEDIEGSDLGDVVTTSFDLDISEGYTGSSSKSMVGLRFSGLAIPPGSNLDSVSITFTARSNETGATNLTFRAENEDNANTYSTTSSDISGRTYTTSSVDWAVPDWTDDQQYTTPNLASLAQTIVNRGGWSSGNALAFNLVGSSVNREAHAYENDDSDPNKRAYIYVRYSVYPANYIAEVDTTSAPSQYTPTTSNLYYAAFTAGNQGDCSNNFGMFNSIGIWPLSLDLINFDAYRENQRVKTNWEIAIADRSKGYIVERSSDNEHFYEIGSIILDSLSKHDLEFEFWDENPINHIQSYYRLRLIDLEERSSLSQAEKVEAIPGNFDFAQIYPSILTNDTDITIELAESQPFLELELYSMDGKLLQKERYTDLQQNHISVDLNTSTSGVYFVKLIGQNQALNQSLLVY